MNRTFNATVTERLQHLQQGWTTLVIFLIRFNEFFFYPLLARLDIGAGVEQPFGCLIVQNRQAV